VFYIAITLVWALRLRRERDSRQRSILRQRQMKCLIDCKGQVDQLFAVGQVLQVLVDRACDDLGASFAVAQLGDRDGDNRPLVRWSGSDQPDADALRLCQRALAGEDVEGAAPVVVRGTWAGAISVWGLDQRERANSAEYLRSLAELAGLAYSRSRLFGAFQEIGVATAVAVELNQKLESMLDEMVDGMGFDYALISLVDPYKETIRTIRGKCAAWLD